MMLTRAFVIPLTMMLLAAAPAASDATPVPHSFDGNESDRSAIRSVLANYTKALSTKDMALFDTLILNREIPLRAASMVRSANDAAATRDYDAFRKAVINGPDFTQRFQDIHIQQDGALAAVTLVFLNTDAKGTDWGWKALQFVRTDRGWKIASELFTYHF